MKQTNIKKSCKTCKIYTDMLGTENIEQEIDDCKKCDKGRINWVKSDKIINDMDNFGAKSIISAILKRAYDDFTEEHCPQYCPMVGTCINQNDSFKNHCSAKKFIHSAWCSTLVEGIEIEQEKIIKSSENKYSNTKVSKETFKYIEAELRDYKLSIKELEEIKREIINEAPIHDNNGGKSYDIGNPTLSKTARLLTDKKIIRLESIICAISKVYSNCDSTKKELIQMKYWSNVYKDNGIFENLNIGERTFYRWKKEIILGIADELGYV
jgi:RinA family phage transcriptional activator